ncbi:Glycosyl hydrolase [Hirschfeldia incana]|nr:Glycosyl hydrolase [Hirschfeldia incana]
MAAWSPSVGIRSSRLINNGIAETWRFPSATGKNKTKLGSETLLVTRKHTYNDLVASALRRYPFSKICASRTSVELKEHVSARGAQVDDLKKVASYLFRTKSGALVKVKVEKKRDKYSIMVYVVSSLELIGDDNKSSSLVMVWGVYRSDSSCFLPLDFENSDQDSQTPFVKSFLSDELMLRLEFDGKESPFYLSFRLKLVSGNDQNGLEMLTHRDTNFCVPVGFTAGHPLPLGLSSGPDGSGDSWNFAFFSRNSKRVVLCLYDDSTSDKPALELDLDPYVNRTGDVWHASVEKTWGFVRYGYRCKEVLNSEEEDDEAESIVLDPYATVIDKSGFTQHKSSKLPTNVAGTFSGVAVRVNHLKALGTNAVLLEPIFSFSDQKGSYFPFHFFSPMNMYGPSNDHESAVKSMKEMVKRLHSEGIEVLLEVVFTYTSESDALQGIDDGSYYYKAGANDSKSYLNCNYPVVQQLILESLRYWVSEFHVDGFCFINASSLMRGVHGEQLSRPPLVEAISFDPLLAKTKLIADCWNPHDMKMAKEEVKFPHWKRWAELNTRYSRDVRNFVRGRGVVSDLATRVCGSGDMFTDGRGPAFSFNYISRNSGLSLVDLVSFSGPPELASELSWNCGEEGETNKSAVLQTRLKQIRNLLFIQYISLGVPVFNMGDECGVSTKGSPLLESRKPFDWNMLASGYGAQITRFISFMTSVRARRSDVFQRSKFLKPENIVWYANDQTTPNWEDTASRFLALGIKVESGEETTEAKKNDLFIGFNASDHPEKRSRWMDW